MKLLLDTHIWICALNQPESLSSKVRRALQKPSNELYLSPISVCETRHLERRGRIRLRQPFELWAKQALEKAPIREAPFALAVARAAVRVELPQSDPGDVFLAATALTFGVTLVTEDEQSIDCPRLSVMANK